MRNIVLAALLAATAGIASAQQSERQMIEEENRYRFQEKNTAKADSMHKEIMKAYPNGWTVRREAFMQAFNHKNDYHEYIIGLLKKYPMEESAKLDAYQEFVYYNAIRSFASDYYSGKYDQQEFISLTPGMDFKTLAEVMRTTAAIYHIKQAVSDTVSYPMAEALIRQMALKVNDHSYCEDGYMSEAQSDSLATALLEGHRGTYAGILLGVGKAEEALRQISLISASNRYTTPAVNESHIKALQQVGKEAMVSDVMKGAFAANAVTPAMLNMLKKDYIAQRGSEAGFDDYLNSLKPESEANALKAEIQKQLINIPYKHFTLKDMNGNTVNSAEWDGKIVVLDFWASWCYPCKNSFPGMQLAVNHFKNDPDVLFYFIDTMERSDGYEQKARDYMKEQGFTFNVLFDAKVAPKKPGNNQVVFKQMNDINHSMAIPRKMFLKDGHVRLTTEGYNGSPSKLADEIVYTIEMLKQAGSK